MDRYFTRSCLYKCIALIVNEYPLENTGLSPQTANCISWVPPVVCMLHSLCKAPVFLVMSGGRVRFLHLLFLGSLFELSLLVVYGAQETQCLPTDLYPREEVQNQLQAFQEKLLHRRTTQPVQKCLFHRNHDFYYSYSINHRHCWTVALLFQCSDVYLARSLNWRGNIALDQYLPFCFFWFPKGADQSAIVTRNRGSILLLWMHTPREP